METVIIDDEIKSIELLEFYLGEYFKDFNIIGKFTDPEEGFEAILKRPPELLFLDINMPNMSGIQVLEKIKHLHHTQTIFLTAHPEHAIDAIKLDAFDYLLKPINLDEIKRIHLKLLDHAKHKQLDTESLRIKVGHDYHFLKSDDIINASSEGNYTTIYCLNKKPFVLTKNLKKVQEEYLTAYPFLRIHQSHIINLKQIESISQKSVTLTNGKALPVSKSCYKELMKYM